jgi:alkylhydroperoxidase/carboxymuconolactone decarboxylase family protein YurZ
MNDVTGNDILDDIREAGRRVLPMHEYLAAHDPNGLRGFNSFLMSSIYEQDALEPKYKEIVLACACVAAGSAVAVIAAHCRKALDFGASRAEVLQAIEMTAAVFATRTMGAGVSALLDADPEGLS